MADLHELRRRLRAFSTETTPRAPLYTRLAEVVADDNQILELLRHAPDGQQMPVLLFAAVHDLLLRGLGPELAQWYPNLADPTRPPSGELATLFRSFCDEHAVEIGSLVGSHHTQTNEVGRCALFVIALHRLSATYQQLSLVDVGTSAGLTLLLTRYAYDFGTVAVGRPSAVELTCGVRGPIDLPSAMPPVVAALGIDQAPIDIHDEEAVRWLEACVWPDQADRFERLREALAIARAHPPDVRRGDAIAGLADAVGDAGSRGHPVVLTSWVLSYLGLDGQRAFVAELDRIASTLDLSWIAAESPALTPGLPIPTTTQPEDRTVLSLTTWRRGVRTTERLGTAHPHGFWLHADEGRGEPPAR